MSTGTVKMTQNEPVDYIDLNAIDFPDKVAFIDAAKRITYLQAKLMADRFALYLMNMGLSRRQVVLVQLPNIVEYFPVHSALYKTGMVWFNLLMNVRHNEIEFAMRETAATAIMIPVYHRNFDYLGMVRDIQQKFPGLEHVFVVGDTVPPGCHSIEAIMNQPLEEQYSTVQFNETMTREGELLEVRITSGTTGFPKVARIISRTANLNRSTPMVERFKIVPEDIFAALAPLSGGGSGPPCKGAAMAQGCTVALVDKFTVENALKLIETEKVTFAAGVPAQIDMILKHPGIDDYDLSSLRAFYYAGAPLSYATAKGIEQKLHCHVISLYGGLDVSYQFATAYDDPAEVRRRSVGKPMSRNLELRLVDDQMNDVAEGEVGELLVRVKKRLDSSDKAVQKADDSLEWQHSGDLCRFDKEGNLYIVGRKKDMILRGGQSIYPAEMESMLMEHPDILNVSIVGVPDEIMGERACVCVIPRPGAQITLGDIIEFLKQRNVAKFKLPEKIAFFDHFPMTADGQKVLKRELAKIVAKTMKG